MRILVIGSGAREHALVAGLAADPKTDALYVSPGNPGMLSLAQQGPKVDVTVPATMVAAAQEVAADLVVIGPEVPLVAGAADALRAAGFAVFGPNQAAAQIEGSKAFAKDVMAAAGVATARAEVVAPGVSDAEIEAALDRFGPTWVVKDDGLAAGKGVVVTPERAAAKAHIAAVHAEGNPVLLESFLDGPEISLFCLVDGETVVPLLPAQDHKRVGDGDTGPNTGGMGAYCPLPWLPASGVERIVQEVCEPVARELVRRGTPYSGLLYAGLAWGKNGPAVVEFNCRFGDPETQAVLALLETPLATLLHAVATGQLAEQPPLQWRAGYALTVVVAAEGYPGKVTSGDVITGADQPGVLHAGTAQNDAGQLVAAGGRVLAVVATGETLAAARTACYEKIDGISLRGSHFRRDIAQKAARGELALP